MIRCHLSTLMGRDKLRISDVSRLTGLNRSTVTSLYKEKGYLFSSSDHIDTVISSSNSIRLPIPCVLVHDIRICHRGRDHRLLQ